jgi:hypothetical protein
MGARQGPGAQANCADLDEGGAVISDRYRLSCIGIPYTIKQSEARVYDATVPPSDVCGDQRAAAEQGAGGELFSRGDRGRTGCWGWRGLPQLGVESAQPPHRVGHWGHGGCGVRARWFAAIHTKTYILYEALVLSKF